MKYQIIERTIPVKENLLPNEHTNINEEYLREPTIPKTVVKVKVKVEWEDDGERKAKIFPSVVSGKYSQKTNFFEEIKRYDYYYAVEIIPDTKGNYGVIYLFKENGSTVKCGDEVFYNVSSQNPIEFDFPVQRNSTVESCIEIYGLDGTLLHESIAKSTRPFREVNAEDHN